MVSVEKLKAARSIKEDGNNSFNRGILSEAQKSYTEVLDMLREEITFTGNDQKKERQSLILAAHLNLAQCALRLGNYVKVVDHCNIALGLDSNNVKAHFRRAKALENLSEYSRALEGYQTVLRLEPNNSAAQKQQSECNKKLSSEEKEKPDDTDNNDMEIVYENWEDAPNSRYKNCTKNPGHEMFISVKDFQINHLPPQYQDQDLFEYFRHQIQVTVLLKVRGNSEHRPEYFPGTHDRYPASGKKYRKSIRYGSGWLRSFSLKEGQGLCPCATCQSLQLPEKHWAKIYIKTARHVVYDKIEGSKTICYFFYNADEDDLQSCPSLCNPVNVESTLNDESVLLFISHDQDLIIQLSKMWTKYTSSHVQVKQKYSTNDLSEDRNILDKFIPLVHHLRDLSAELHQQVDTLKALCCGDPPTEYLKHLAKQNGKDEDEVQRLGKRQQNKLDQGNEYENYIMKACLNDVELSCFASVDRLEEMYQDLVETENGKQELVTYYSELVFLTRMLEKKVIDYRWMILHWREKDITTAQPVIEDYNEAHPLTVIVSHPHGCSKKISIGMVIDNVSESDRLYRQFTYSAATCAGSSGAPVFILGDISGVTARPHSRFGVSASGTDEQRNESAMSLNL